jgi:hypothetical protein
MEQMPIETKSNRVDLVLVGRFSPADFLPDKLSSFGVITAGDAKTAKYTQLLPRQLVEYSLEWCTIQVTETRLIVQTVKVPYIRIADLVLKALQDVSAGAVMMFGINREFVFRFPDIASRDRAGLRLSPLTAWGDWGKSIEKDLAHPQAERKHGGLVSITMRQLNPDDREEGRIDVYVGSVNELSNEFCAMVKVNDHYQLSATQIAENEPEQAPALREKIQTAKMLDILSRNFDASVTRAQSIADGLISHE